MWRRSLAGDGLTMRIIVLGSAAGGGFPQWNCACPNCRKPGRVTPTCARGRNPDLAVTADGVHWLLFNASPDIRAQIMATRRPPIRRARRGATRPIAAVLLTNGDVDHVAGLLTLREKQPFGLYGTQATSTSSRDNPSSAFSTGRRAASAARARPARRTGAGLAVQIFAVPGKVPLYLEARRGRDRRRRPTSTIGVGCRRRAQPPRLHSRLRRRSRRRCGTALDGAPLVLFDGTVFEDDEMTAPASAKTGAPHGPHADVRRPDGSLARLDGVAIGRRIYIHINNTNPVLVEASPSGARSRRRVGASPMTAWSSSYERRSIRRHGDVARRLEAALRDIGATRYHHLHPVPAAAPVGRMLAADEVQAWALNRYHYQSSIPHQGRPHPRPHATTRLCGANGASASSTMTASARATAASRIGCG